MLSLIKSGLEWWRLLSATVWQLPLAATILTLPFIKWSLTIDGWLKALPPYWLTVLAWALLVSIVFLITFYLKLKSERSNKLTLKYNIYWDKKKNPHCPLCQKPVSYGNWGIEHKTYYCKPCKSYNYLIDALGNKLDPEKVLSEL